MTLRKACSEIAELLFANKYLPADVTHTFVAFAVGPPSAMWKCTGSTGEPSFDQKESSTARF